MNTAIGLINIVKEKIELSAIIANKKSNDDIRAEACYAMHYLFAMLL